MRQDAEQAAAKEAGITLPEPVADPAAEDQISTALFDLNEQEIAAIQAMEDEIQQIEEQVMADATQTGDAAIV